MSTKDKTFFQDSWLEGEEFKDWLVKASDTSQARCKPCHKTFALSNMGVQALKSHAAGKKHKDISQKVSCFFKKPTHSSTNIVTQENQETSQVTKKKDTQQTLELTIASSDVIKAEIRWAIDSVLKGNSNNQNKNTNNLLKVMFPDSNIAKLFSLGPDKLRYMCNYGLAPYFSQLLKEEVQKSEMYIISFDESLNDATQSCQMDLIVKYWDNTEQKTKARYWNTSYLGHSAHTDLLEHFNKNLDCLDSSKMIQISMDGPSVNHKFLKGVVKEREECKIPSLIDIGSCSLHVIHGAFRLGAEKSGWKVKKTLRGLWQIFHDSPARRDDYEALSGSTTYPLAFCSTRWVESKSVADRAITIWPNVEKLVTFWEQLPKSKRPKSKSYESIKAAAHDVLTVAKLEFFSYVASIVEPFLKCYQTDKPMVPFLYFDLKTLITSLLKLFIKETVISEAKTASQLMKIDLDDSNFIPNKNIEIGFATEATLSELKRTDGITAAEEKKFRLECRTFLTGLVSKLFERIPLDSVVVRAASVFDPKIMIEYRYEQIEKVVKRLLHYLMGLKILTASTCNKITQQFSMFHKDVQSCREKFTKYNRKEERLDSFFFAAFPEITKQYPDFTFLLKLILVLSHGQASVERGFSLRNSTLKDNITETSIDSKRMIIDHMLSNNVTADTIQISTPIILSVKSARTKYEQEKRSKASAEKLAQTDNHSKQLSDQIKQLKVKTDELQKTANYLDVEFTNSIFEAENKPSEQSTLIAKATALKRKSNLKKEEIKEIEELILVLEKKRKV